VLDTGESRRPWGSRYVRTLVPLLFRVASSYVVHSEFDRQLVSAAYGIPLQRLHVIPHIAYALDGWPLSDRPRPKQVDDECRLLPPDKDRCPATEHDGRSPNDGRVDEGRAGRPELWP
jgi:hypothetical protein